MSTGRRTALWRRPAPILHHEYEADDDHAPAHRPLSPRIAAPREPVDPAHIGRRVVRRRAKGMDAGAVAAALEDARFDARQASRHEDLADDVRGPAELAETTQHSWQISTLVGKRRRCCSVGCEV
ncbi:hypothetical protein [Streptomyces prasinus]|uniref:hypothetical protein n=1 Tax=Streptomyces prasinus TaxID=67345 RepID=UPI0006EB3A7C|nr:hypothetical protein [Streptomyces prasinus]